MVSDQLVENICRELCTLRGGDPNTGVDVPEPSPIAGVQNYRRVQAWELLQQEVLDFLTVQQAVMSVASRQVN